MKNSIITSVANLKHLLFVADSSKTSATGYIHYQDGKLWATDGSAMLFFDCDPVARTSGVQPLPEGRYCLPRAEVLAFIKGRKGDLKLDLATFTNNASMQINGCSFLKNVEYREVGIKEFKAWREGFSESFGLNFGFRFAKNAIEVCTGSDKSYTVAMSHSIEPVPETPITVFRSVYANLLQKIHWNNVGAIVHHKPIVFADPGKMQFVVMPMKINRAETLLRAFESPIEAF